MLNKLLNVDKMQDDYDRLTTDLLNWIYNKIHQLENRNFPNNLHGIQEEMTKFKNYRVSEKPTKYVLNFSALYLGIFVNFLLL